MSSTSDNHLWEETLLLLASNRLLNLGRFLKPDVQIQMDMILNSPDLWTIRHNGAVALRLTQEDIRVRLFVKQVSLEPSIEKNILQAMNSGKNAVYPTVRAAIRTYSHQANDRYFECNDPFNSKVPNRVTVCLLKQTAFNGAIDTNPFSYRLMNMSSIRMLIGGEEYPYEQLELNHDNGRKDLKGYARYLEATGCTRRGHGNLVSQEDWGNGKHVCLLVFDTTSNQNPDSPALNPELEGQMRIIIEFGANPPAALTVLVYGEFENVMEITGPGVVTYDMNQ